jgi:hypothetical protein
MTKKHNHNYARRYGFWKEHIHGIPDLEYTKRNQRIPCELHCTKDEFGIDPTL